ncbi:hypothetical protein Tco_0401449 [Tanacetum coccineum]
MLSRPCSVLAQGVVLSGTRRDNCVWHKRQGHINEARLRVLEKQGLLSKKSIGGYGFRFKHVAFGMFKEWKQLVENQTGRTVKKLRTDNGFEFLTTTKVIKVEFEKLESIKISDASLTCNTSLEIFNEEFNRMSRMDDDLFTYEVEISEVTNIPYDLKKEDDLEQQMSHEYDDDMEYDPSDVEFTKWLALKNFNYNKMDHYTMKALWIYWARGDDEVELTNEESSDYEDKDEVAKIFRIVTNVYDCETPLCRAFREFNYLLQIDPNLLTEDIEGFKTYEYYKDDWIYKWNKDVPWVHEKPWMDNGAWKESCNTLQNTIRSGIQYLGWRDDGYCNGGNLPGAYVVGKALRYQYFKWYDALKDGKLKEEALKNKVIMEGIIEDEDNESSNEGWRSWNVYENNNHGHEERDYEMEHEDNERRELFDDHERPVCNIRRFEMIKYSFGQDEEYVVVKENEYDDLTSTSEDAC